MLHCNPFIPIMLGEWWFHVSVNSWYHQTFNLSHGFVWFLYALFLEGQLHRYFPCAEWWFVRSDRDRERHRQKEKALPSVCSHPRWLCDWDCRGWNQDPGTSPSSKDSSFWAAFQHFPQSVSKQLDGKWSNWLVILAGSTFIFCATTLALFLFSSKLLYFKLQRFPST